MAHQPTIYQSLAAITTVGSLLLLPGCPPYQEGAIPTTPAPPTKSELRARGNNAQSGAQLPGSKFIEASAASKNASPVLRTHISSDRRFSFNKKECRIHNGTTFIGIHGAFWRPEMEESLKFVTGEMLTKVEKEIGSAYPPDQVKKEAINVLNEKFQTVVFSDSDSETSILETLVKENACGNKIVAFGHSQGGWTGASVFDKLKTKHGIEIETFVTGGAWGGLGRVPVLNWFRKNIKEKPAGVKNYQPFVSAGDLLGADLLPLDEPTAVKPVILPWKVAHVDYTRCSKAKGNAELWNGFCKPLLEAVSSVSLPTAQPAIQLARTRLELHERYAYGQDPRREVSETVLPLISNLNDPPRQCPTL